MAWTSWSRTWATTRRTTTSRKPPRCNSKIWRWKRMYLNLRADQRLKQNHEDVRISASSSTKAVPIGEGKWLEDYSSVAYPVSKQMSTLLRHGDLPREDDGAIEFWRIRNIFRTMCILNSGQMKNGRAQCEKEEETRKDFNIVLIHQEKKFLITELFQGQSGRSLIDPSLQDNVFNSGTISSSTFITSKCAINLHSIMN